MEKYDLCVIGAGPSGYAAAMRALDYNKKVLLVEGKKLGGAGLWNGALSSKTWWELSRQISTVRHHLNLQGKDMPRIRFKEVYNEVLNATNMRQAQLLSQIQYAGNKDIDENITFKEGKAYIDTPHTVKITCEDNSEEVIETEHIIIATGSRPRQLPDIEIDEEYILSSDGIEHLRDFPKSMVILGAGVIGCEYATVFSNFGYTKVHLIDKGDRILPFEDPDVVNRIENNFEKNNVLIHRKSRLIRMEVVDDRVEYELEYHNGRKQLFTVEKALVSVGRVPNIENLWSESVPIEFDDRGIINNDTQTSVPNIHAVGDITSDMALVNIGELEGRHAVDQIFGSTNKELNYKNVSTIMFLNPEVAGVGFNEQQLKDKGTDYRVVTLDYECIPRAIARQLTDGFMKIIVTDDPDMKILGMRVVGFSASASIEAIALLIHMNQGIEQMAELVHPHPSITEGIQECARILCGKSILKPHLLKEHVTCKAWRSGEYVDLLKLNLIE
ncbi:NAD(P)/FAD-dependent oxidoreductase [Mangrovivirga sp. M17]|uniref:NAD(P)/FAD-dependent oxidoreductase n=1 Tax=Mangrovivirga halotolerans TaxID=2993936 RepID=A0ABT3RWX8_9BACT|nr:NAD(P)/FAD-dependent oxidoreductase [Mangrovivirga halotolerans]MCX2745717.1 NAD(P)/FAD-dependent oxidoreductase [Mangrovivirga halotolerans]